MGKTCETSKATWTLLRFPRRVDVTHLGRTPDSGISTQGLCVASGCGDGEGVGGAQL